MPVACWNIRHGLVLAVVGMACAHAMEGDLLSDANRFILTVDQLAAKRVEIAADREAMAGDLEKPPALRHDVLEFFKDRFDAGILRLMRVSDRRALKVDLNFRPGPLPRPIRNRKNLPEDAASYIAQFDQWVALQQTVEADIERMRSDAAAQNLEALALSATAFLEDSRARHAARLQWQADLRGMRKDTEFKGTGKPVPPPGETLKAHVSEFLADRAAWEQLVAQTDAARESLRAVLQAPESLEGAVFNFLTARRAQCVKGLELALDRRRMRKDVGLGMGAKGEVNPGTEVSAKDEDKSDEDGQLEESAGDSGAK